MTFNNYEIPKEYIDKYKVTSRDKRDFQKFWINESVALKEMSNLSKDDISAKYKNNIYINQN
ncbi:MAG: hypothetical protein KH415_08295 [Clostridium sp.]|nr:hypothetical protein [Clostridium sp.]